MEPIKRQLYILPPKFETLDFHEVMEWATNEVLRLDEENLRLRERLADIEKGQQVNREVAKRAAVSARKPHEGTTPGRGN